MSAQRLNVALVFDVLAELMSGDFEQDDFLLLTDISWSDLLIATWNCMIERGEGVLANYGNLNGQILHHRDTFTLFVEMPEATRVGDALAAAISFDLIMDKDAAHLLPVGMWALTMQPDSKVAVEWIGSRKTRKVLFQGGMSVAAFRHIANKLGFTDFRVLEELESKGFAPEPMQDSAPNRIPDTLALLAA